MCAKTIPIKQRNFGQPFVVVGVIIEKDGKFLLIQEGKVDKGKWNIPAGWLDLNEEIIPGAIRETKEETGLDINITGLLGVYSSSKLVGKNITHPVRFIFAAKPLNQKLNYSQDEILDAKWFTYEEIKTMGEKLRSQTIIRQIEDYLAGERYPLAIIKPHLDRL